MFSPTKINPLALTDSTANALSVVGISWLLVAQMIIFPEAFFESNESGTQFLHLGTEEDTMRHEDDEFEEQFIRILLAKQGYEPCI